MEKVEQPFLYTGAYYDREVGLYYLRARYYSPELRRFIQRDPILFDGRINLYGYTGCDFVNYGDWEGRFPIKLIIIAMISYKTYKFAKFSYKCYICLSKFNSPEMQECKVRYSDPDYCLNNSIASPASEILRRCYPRECDEGCMELLKWIYQTTWRGGRF